MKDAVKEYYGQVLQHTDDLQTSACCTDVGVPDEQRRLLANIHDDCLLYTSDAADDQGLGGGSGGGGGG